MTITRPTPTSVAIKTNQTTVSIDASGEITIGDKKIEGPGEYDVAGVGLQAFGGTTLFLIENVRVEALFEPPVKERGSDEEELIEPDVLLVMFPLDKATADLVKKIEPRVVLLTTDTNTEALEAKPETIVQQPSVKLTAQNLPAEERMHYLLAV